jgi:hypothetical protein
VFTIRTEDNQDLPVSKVGPYRIRVVRMQLDIEVLDASGKLTGVIPSSVEAVFEANFFPGLLEYLMRQGVTLADPAPTPLEPV